MTSSSRIEGSRTCSMPHSIHISQKSSFHRFTLGARSARSGCFKKGAIYLRSISNVNCSMNLQWYHRSGILQIYESQTNLTMKGIFGALETRDSTALDPCSQLFTLSIHQMKLLPSFFTASLTMESQWTTSAPLVATQSSLHWCKGKIINVKQNLPT